MVRRDSPSWSIRSLATLGVTGRADLRRLLGGWDDMNPNCGSTRAQSHVVGVALLLGVAVISMSALTASVGVLIEHQVTNADATRIADEMDAAFAPVETTGVHRERLSFSRGTLTTVDRQLRILVGSKVVRTVDVDALVFTAGNQRVAFVAGAIVRGKPGNAWFHAEPPIVVSPNGGVFIVGAPKIGSAGAVSGTGGVAAMMRMNVTHARERIGNGTYSVSIETATPEPFVRYFEERGRTVERRDIDGDGIESVIVTPERKRTVYLVIHNLNVVINGG